MRLLFLKKLKNQNIDIDISAAAEHYFDETLKNALKTGRYLPWAITMYFLNFFYNQPQNLYPNNTKNEGWVTNQYWHTPKAYNYMDIEQLKPYAAGAATCS
jgi:protein-tyrosine phosphatase